MRVTLWITTAIHLDTPKSGLDPFSLLVMGAILFFPCRPLLKVQSLSQLGLKPFRANYQDLLRGSAIALAVIELPYGQSAAKVLIFPHVEVR